MRLHEEEHGKLFPDANRSKVVLEALLAEVERRDVRLLAGERALDVAANADGGYRLTTSRGVHEVARVVLGTGGLSLPKTGSDGLGLEIARAFGHSVVPTTPALMPLVLDGAFHAPLSGVAHEVELAVLDPGRRPFRRKGSLLWTHFGVSGPVVLDASRAYLRAGLEGGSPVLEVNLLPGRDFAWRLVSGSRGSSQIRTSDLEGAYGEVITPIPAGAPRAGASDPARGRPHPCLRRRSHR